MRAMSNEALYNVYFKKLSSVYSRARYDYDTGVNSSRLKF